MKHELVTARDQAILARAAAILAEANFPFSCLASVEVDHEAGRILIISAANVEQDRVAVGFRLSDALTRMQSDAPIACRALSPKATAQISSAGELFYCYAAAGDRATTAREPAITTHFTFGSLSLSTVVDYSDSPYRAAYAALQAGHYPSIRRIGRLFRSRAASRVFAASLQRMAGALHHQEAISTQPAIPVSHEAKPAGPTPEVRFQAWLTGLQTHLELMSRCRSRFTDLDTHDAQIGAVWIWPTSCRPTDHIAANTHYSLAA